MIEWCLQDSSIKMLFAGHEIRDSTKAIRVAARVVFLCVNLFFTVLPETVQNTFLHT